ncbi:MAG TPA: glycosyltransferase [Vicinamibacterales bacterium]|nr:glycosyltransferase [Vicinamibacterales bacterium]
MRCAFFSIVVPTFARTALLARCLASLAALDYPRDRYEVIVVNDGGASIEVESAVSRAAGGARVTVVHRAHAGPAAARNAGVAASRGDALAFIDDDCLADRSWLSAMAARLAQTPAAVLGGRVVNALEENAYARASQLLLAYVYRYYHEEGRGTLRFFTTNNLAMLARTFATVGPFDERFRLACEDRDWCDRCLYANVPLVYAPEAVVHHAHALTLSTFVNQHRRYGEGAHRFHQTRAERRGEHVRVEPFGFYLGMLKMPFALRDPQPLRMALLLTTTQVASTVGFVWATLRASSRRGVGELGRSPIDPGIRR